MTNPAANMLFKEGFKDCQMSVTSAETTIFLFFWHVYILRLPWHYRKNFWRELTKNEWVKKKRKMEH